eukprot:gb/GEZN01015497.1/.p1 GENE.gb/GEZN01015497.1/~~gb/GEZN01015497.1/.p1  ORF type:complete len:252 (+),score=18.13 gb/GEZN01015497.1/:59-814(+)
MQTREGGESIAAEERIQFSHLKDGTASEKNAGARRNLWVFAVALITIASVAITYGVKNHAAPSENPATTVTFSRSVLSAASASSEQDEVSEKSAYVLCGFLYDGNEFKRQALLMPSVVGDFDQVNDGQIVFTSAPLYKFHVTERVRVGYVAFRRLTSNRERPGQTPIGLQQETGDFYFDGGDSSMIYETAVTGTTTYPDGTPLDFLGNYGRGALLGYKDINIRIVRTGSIRNVQILFTEEVCRAIDGKILQ